MVHVPSFAEQECRCSLSDPLHLLLYQRRAILDNTVLILLCGLPVGDTIFLIYSAILHGQQLSHGPLTNPKRLQQCTVTIDRF